MLEVVAACTIDGLSSASVSPHSSIVVNFFCFSCNTTSASISKFMMEKMIQILSRDREKGGFEMVLTHSEKKFELSRTK